MVVVAVGKDFRLTTVTQRTNDERTRTRTPVASEISRQPSLFVLLSFLGAAHHHGMYTSADF